MAVVVFITTTIDKVVRMFYTVGAGGAWGIVSYGRPFPHFGNYKKMPARVNIPIAELLQLIEKHQGNVSAIAREVRHDWETVSDRIKESAQASRLLRSQREVRFDAVVESLYDMAIKEHNVTAAIFIAKADPVAKRRGWGERTEIAGHDGGPLAVEHTHHLAEVSDDDLRRNLAAFGRAALAASGRAPIPDDSGGATGDDSESESQ